MRSPRASGIAPARPTTASRSACIERTSLTLELDTTFRPPPWLANRHVQTVLASSSLRQRWLRARLQPVLRARRELLLECGGGVRLQAFHSAGAASARAKRIAVLLHGWEGSAESLYVGSLAQQLYGRGFDVLCLNLRDHGATHHLNRELFHSCRLPEVVGALHAIQWRFDGCPLHLAGFSLGGNFMLRAAAEAAAHGLAIARVVAISPVLNPVATLDALERQPRIYHRYFVRKWTRSLGLKQRAWPADYDFGALTRTASLRQMTRELVERFTAFGTLEAYLNGYAILDGRLAALAAPATVITALDDPIIPARDLERLPRIPALRIILTRHGGHCGFLDRLDGWTWAERRTTDELDAATPALSTRRQGPMLAPALSPGRASPRS
jgi:uncharacterized protein